MNEMGGDRSNTITLPEGGDRRTGCQKETLGDVRSRHIRRRSRQNQHGVRQIKGPVINNRDTKRDGNHFSHHEMGGGGGGRAHQVKF